MKSRVRSLLPVLLPALLGLLVHARGISHPFIADDTLLIHTNPQVRGEASWRRLLLADWFDSTSGGSPSGASPSSAIGYYRPVTKASFRATWALFGPSAPAFHAGNVALHVLCAALLGGLLSTLVGPLPALVGASLWAVHPMTVQAVQNVAARSDLLAAFFSLAALSLHARWCVRGGISLAAAVGLLTALASGSKESAVLLPAAVGLLGLARGLGPGRALAGALPSLGAAAAVTLLRLSFAGLSPEPNALASLPLAGRASCILAAAGSYVLPLVLGRPVVRLPQVPASFAEPAVAAGCLLFAAAGVAALRGRFRTPTAFLALSSLLFLAPALAVWLIHIPSWRGEVPVAERWLYLPSAAACGLAALALGWLPRRTSLFLGALLVAAFAFVSWGMVPAYASAEAYNEFAAAEILGAPPRNPREAHLGNLFRAARADDAGRTAEAREELRAADALAPGLPDHAWQLAVLELRSGNPAAAEPLVRRLLSPAFAGDPAFVRQRRDFGNDTLQRLPRGQLLLLLVRVLAAEGRGAEARAVLAEAEPLFAGTREAGEYRRVAALVAPSGGTSAP